MSVKTKIDLNDLKQQWIKDPCWEIEDTEGYEDFHDELLAWRLNYEKKAEKTRKKIQKQKIKLLYKLKLGEKILISTSKLDVTTYLRKVPNGWICEYKGENENQTVISSCFIPFIKR